MKVKNLTSVLFLGLFLSFGLLTSCSDDDPVIEKPKNKKKKVLTKKVDSAVKI